jgi:hypothetical protein
MRDLPRATWVDGRPSSKRLLVILVRGNARAAGPPLSSSVGAVMRLVTASRTSKSRFPSNREHPPPGRGSQRDCIVSGSCSGWAVSPAPVETPAYRRSSRVSTAPRVDHCADSPQGGGRIMKRLTTRAATAIGAAGAASRNAGQQRRGAGARNSPTTPPAPSRRRTASPARSSQARA